MTNTEILAQLQNIIQETLDAPDLTLTAATTASDVDGWDSLAHIRILVAVEAEFKVHFSVHEIARIDDVGAFVELISSKSAV